MPSASSGARTGRTRTPPRSPATGRWTCGRSSPSTTASSSTSCHSGRPTLRCAKRSSSTTRQGCMRFKALLCAFAAFSGAALAQEAQENLAGAGVRAKPAYDGSKSEHLDVVPVLNYYRGPLFARTTQGVLEGGARALVAKGLHVGAQLAYEEGRRSSESSFLAGRNVPNVNPSASIGAHAEYDFKVGPAPLNLLARWRRDVNSERGAQLDLRATAGVYESGPLAAAVYAQETWATQSS